MIINISKKVYFSIEILLILGSILFLIGAGWFGHAALHDRELDQCVIELEATQEITQSCAALTQRLTNLIEGMKIHINTCHVGYSYLEGIARTCLLNDNDPQNGLDNYFNLDGAILNIGGDGVEDGGHVKKSGGGNE